MDILDWVSKHFVTLVIVAGVLAQLIKAVRGQKDTDEDAASSPTDRQFDDPELAERTRKIREDIQRKIESRRRAAGQGGYTEAAPPAPPPLAREVVVERVPEPVPAATSRLEQQRHAEILEQQAALAEKMREIELMKAAAARRTEFERATADTQTENKVAARGALLGELRGAHALRRAIVLREVLGPPVALR
jgi:type IV secretory pathway VirB10-like protein